MAQHGETANFLAGGESVQLKGVEPDVVIPGPPTILRWNLPTLQAPPGIPNSGSITVNAIPGAVTNGSGDPLQQTFTNTATLSGTDGSNNPFSDTATADVIVQKPPLDVQKSVDKSFLSLPAGVRAVRCGDCETCTVHCPNGVRVAERVARAQEMFA